jgi:hypothetical protein
MSDGFLGRWSKRKLEVKDGRAVEPEPPPVASDLPVAESPPPAETAAVAAATEDEGVSRAMQPPDTRAATEMRAQQQPPLTLEDVKALTRDSDFSRFARAEVAPEVKNAAMKKLFADPRYNVMDGLDTYIDDYSKADPIPNAMLRQLVSAKFLGLFDKEEKEEAEAAAAAAREAAGQPRDVADNPMAQSVAQSEPPPPAVPEAPSHADPDLRLQQDDAPPGEDPGRGTQ